MLRFILILIAIYLIWKVLKNLKIIITKKQSPISKNKFDHIEEADFEDITNKKEDE